MFHKALKNKNRPPFLLCLRQMLANAGTNPGVTNNDHCPAMSLVHICLLTNPNANKVELVDHLANSVTGTKPGVTNNDHDCCFPPVCSFLVGSGQANIAEISDRFVLNSNNSNDNFSIPIMTMIAVFLLFAPFLSTWLGGQSEGKHCGNIRQFCFIFHFDL